MENQDKTTSLSMRFQTKDIELVELEIRIDANFEIDRVSFVTTQEKLKESSDEIFALEKPVEIETPSFVHRFKLHAFEIIYLLETGLFEGVSAN